MDTIISHSPSETEAFGERIGRFIPAGCVIGLKGDLGAGKTQFVRGFARGLGVRERVHSPTFALLNIYSSGRVPMYHIDLYRLETDAQIMAAGLAEYFSPDGVTVVEWMDRWSGGKPRCYHAITLEVISEMERRIIYVDSGA